MTDVIHPTPVDTSGIADPGIQALTILAASLGWNVVRKLNSPVILNAKDGTKKPLPTNTSVRFGVFQSSLRTILTHRDEDKDPTTALVEKISKETKLGVSHQREIYNSLGLAAPRRPKPEPQPEIATPPQVPPDVKLFETSRRRTRGHAQFLDKKKTEQYAWDSDWSDEVTMSDGSVHFECLWCDKQFENPVLAGMHGSRFHRDKAPIPARYKGWSTFDMKRDQGLVYVVDAATGEILRPAERANPKAVEQGRKGAETLRRQREGVQPEPEPPVTEPAEPEAHVLQTFVEPAPEPVKFSTEISYPEQLNETERLRLIAVIAGGDRVADLEAENAQLRSRINELEGNLRALKDLLGGI